MKTLALTLLLGACAPAAYEIVKPEDRPTAGRGGNPSPTTQPEAKPRTDAEPTTPSDPDPTQGDPTQGDPTQGDPTQGDPTQGGGKLPPIQQSEPKLPPKDIDPDMPIQGKPPQCNQVTVCSVRQLPPCNRSNDGIFAQVMGDGLYRCDNGKWQNQENPVWGHLN